MKILVTGACGQLGHDVMEELLRRGHEGIGSDMLQADSAEAAAFRDGKAKYVCLDITDRSAVRYTLERLKPDAVIHCAAWTAVDAAEDPGNREKVRMINAEGTAYIAEACKAAGARMMYISTDYVFDGRGEEPWSPDCTDFAPLNYYGETKLAGETAVRETLDRYYIVRIEWVFGKYGRNFIRTMLNVGRKVDAVRVVNDQIGTPTYTADLAILLADMIESDRFGVYHATNEGGCISWYDLACEVFRQAGYDTRVLPVTTEEYGASTAARPFNSRLDKRKLIANGFSPLPPWQDAVRRYLQQTGFIR